MTTFATTWFLAWAMSRAVTCAPMPEVVLHPVYQQVNPISATQVQLYTVHDATISGSVYRVVETQLANDRGHVSEITHTDYFIDGVYQHGGVPAFQGGARTRPAWCDLPSVEPYTL